MKILFQSYNTCCQNMSGGVNVRMHQILDLLKDRGIKVDFFNTFETKVDDYDIIHFFMLHQEHQGLIKMAKEKGKKIVMSSIVNLGTNRWKQRLYRGFINKLPITTFDKLKCQQLQFCDIIIAETEAEASFIEKHYNIHRNKIRVIPNGINTDECNSDVIFNRVPSLKKYILQVGRFDKNKNQLNVIKAMKGTGLDVVFIGGPNHSDTKYYDECIKVADGDEHIHFLGWVSQDDILLKSAYANADILVLPSFRETFGLVVLEAAILGAKLVLSETLPILSYSSFKDVPTFNPYSINDIRNVLINTFDKPKNATLKTDVTNEFSWDRIIDEHIDIYKGLLEK